MTALDKETKLYANGLGHMTKMAVMPMIKNPLQIFSRTRRPMNLECCIRDVGPIKFVQIMFLG